MLDRQLYNLARYVAASYKGRSIVTLSDSNKVTSFNELLLNYFNIKVSFAITRNINKVDENKIKYIDFIKYKQDKYYLVSIDQGFNEKFYNQIISYGYSEFKDFICLNFKPINKTLDFSNKTKIEDEFGNIFISKTKCSLTVSFSGFNNKIVIFENVIFKHRLSITLTHDTLIVINDNVIFSGDVKILTIGLLDGHCKLKIGNNVKFYGNIDFVLYHPSSVIVGDRSTFGSNNTIYATANHKIILSKDCMFSRDIFVWGGDGHSIFDINSKQKLNYTNFDYYKFNYRDYIVIGSHTWCGARAFILNKTQIGSGSIIGANSLVKGIFPNNCILAGNPAKIIKYDVYWNRNPAMSIPEYINNYEQIDYNNRSYTVSLPVFGKKILLLADKIDDVTSLLKVLDDNGNYITVLVNSLEKNYYFSQFINVRILLYSTSHELFNKIYDVYEYAYLFYHDFKYLGFLFSKVSFETVIYYSDKKDNGFEASDQYNGCSFIKEYKKLFKKLIFTGNACFIPQEKLPNSYNLHI